MKIQFILKETIKTNQDFVNFVITATKEWRTKSGQSIQQVLNEYDALVLGAAQAFPEDQRDKAIHWITDGIMDGNITPEEYDGDIIPSAVPGQTNGTTKSSLSSILELFVKYWPKFDSNESKDILDYKNCKEIMSVTTPYLFDELGMRRPPKQQPPNKIYSTDKNSNLDSLSKFGFSEDELRKLNESTEEVKPLYGAGHYDNMIMKAAEPFQGQEKDKVIKWIMKGMLEGTITPNEYDIKYPQTKSQLDATLIFFAKYAPKFKPNESRDINDYKNVFGLLTVLIPYILEEHGMDEPEQEPNKVHNVDKNHSLDVFKKFGFSEDEINKLSID